MRQAARRNVAYRRRPRRSAPVYRRYAQYALTLAIFLAIAVAGAWFGLIETVQPAGRAVVNDGDTLTLDGERIRLRGIDAPEYSQVCMRSGVEYNCGGEAARALRALVAGRNVACSGWERDQYDRLLATCSVGDADVGRRMVESGWAVSYGSYGREEVAARRDGNGLWAGEFERPRAWRERHGDLSGREHDMVSILQGWWRAIFGD